jgi:hypothetical protein
MDQAASLRRLAKVDWSVHAQAPCQAQAQIRAHVPRVRTGTLARFPGNGYSMFRGGKDMKNWVMFTKRTEDPKLAYLEAMLDRQAIPHRRNGESWHAPILEVPENRLDEAWALLSVKIGKRTFDDIPDDARIFRSAMNSVWL